jgi:hypothetical protein
MPGFSNTSRLQKRVLRVSHFPAYEEFFVVADPTNPTWSTATDAGKPVKMSGSMVDLCADGDEIFGFVQSVEGGLHDRIDSTQVGAVIMEGRLHALDEAGTLAIGDRVVSGTQVVVGGVHPAASAVGQNPAGRVKVAAGATVFNWMVVEVYGTGVDRPVLLQRV